MPKAFTEHQKERIRSRLLEEGYRHFSAHGLRKTNVEELARAAHISKGAFYLFYESKEALFMDVMELAEARFRTELLAVIERPGPSPHTRLLTVFQTAFGLLKTIPMLQVFTGSDYEMLFRAVPEAKLEEHLTNDRVFLQELVTRCRQAGIPVQAKPEQIAGLLYPLVLAVIHDQDTIASRLTADMDVLLELIAAFCLGEVQVGSSIGRGRQARARSKA